MAHIVNITMTLLNISRKWLGLLKCWGVAYENCDALAIAWLVIKGMSKEDNNESITLIWRGSIHSGSRFVTRKMHLIVASWLGLDSCERVGGYLRAAEPGISHMNYFKVWYEKGASAQGCLVEMACHRVGVLQCEFDYPLRGDYFTTFHYIGLKL